MARGRGRRRRRPARAVSPEYAVAVAVEAKLFGRLRLLTIDAAVDVVRPSPVTDGADRPDGPSVRTDGAGPFRAEVEAVLREARLALEPELP